MLCGAHCLNAERNRNEEENPIVIVLDNDEIAFDDPALYGTVFNSMGGGVRIDARLPNGRHLPGSPDVTGNDDGSENWFCFPVPGVPGIEIHLTAIDSDFKETTIRIPVR